MRNTQASPRLMLHHVASESGKRESFDRIARSSNSPIINLDSRCRRGEISVAEAHRVRAPIFRGQIIRVDPIAIRFESFGCFARRISIREDIRFVGKDIIPSREIIRFCRALSKKRSFRFGGSRRGPRGAVASSRKSAIFSPIERPGRPCIEFGHLAFLHQQRNPGETF